MYVAGFSRNSGLKILINLLNRMPENYFKIKDK
jgi:hypothetical protein